MAIESGCNEPDAAASEAVPARESVASPGYEGRAGARTSARERTPDIDLLLQTLQSQSRWRTAERFRAAALLGELPLDDRRRRFVAERLRADLLERIDPDFGLVLSHWLGRCTCAASMLLLTIGTAYVLFAPDSRGLVLDNLAQLIALAPWLALAALLLTIFSGPVSLPLSMAADRIYRSRCRPLVMALGNLRHPFGVNALSAAYCVPELHDAAAPGLRSSIESLTSRHYGELGRDVVSNLCKALARSEAYDRVHLLYALEMIGDSRAIPLVARLAGRKDANAERTLAVLLERRAAEQASSLLLRASDAPVAAPQTLLRASNSSMDQEARMLLRQVGGDQTVLQEGS